MKKVLCILLAVGLLLTFASCAANEPETNHTTIPTQPTQTQPQTEPSEGDNRIKAPDFTVFDRNGTAVKLSDFVGKPVVLNFWSSNCPPCRNEMPDFQVAYEFMDGKVEFVMVNLTDGYWDTPESAAAFIDQNAFTFPIYLDTTQEAAGAYYITSIPTTYFIDAEGYLVTRASGMLDLETLLTGINMIQQ